MLEIENVSSALWCTYFSLHACMGSKQWSFVGLELRCAGWLLCVGMDRCKKKVFIWSVNLRSVFLGLIVVFLACFFFLESYWDLLVKHPRKWPMASNMVWGVGGERTDRYCDLILFKCTKKLSYKKKINPKSTLESTLVYHWTEEMQKT